MKKSIKILIAVFVLLPLVAFPAIVAYQDWQKNQTASVVPDAQGLADLLDLQSTEGQDYQGQGINIGILMSTYPDQDSVQKLIGDEKLFGLQKTAWQLGTPLEKERNAALVTLLAKLSPMSTVYLGYIGSDHIADDIDSAVQQFSNHSVDIIVNLITLPQLNQQDVDRFTTTMEAAVKSDGILWLNSAGNYGQGYYASTLGTANAANATVDEGCYSFDGSSALKVIATDDSGQWGNLFALVNWTNPDARLILDAYQDNRLKVPIEAPVITSGMATKLDLKGINAGQTVYLTLCDLQYAKHDSSDVDFKIYISDGQIVSVTDPASRGNSIPPPNDSPSTLTIGALSADTSGIADYTSQFDATGSEKKPEILTYGTLSSPYGVINGTGVSTTVIAGIAADYWSKKPDSTSDDISKQLLSMRSSDRKILRAYPPTTNGFASPIVILSILMLYYISIFLTVQAGTKPPKIKGSVSPSMALPSDIITGPKAANVVRKESDQLPSIPPNNLKTGTKIVNSNAEQPDKPVAPRSQVFISYSHRDNRLLEELTTMLRPLTRQGIKLWSDKKIAPGSNWKIEIQAALASAKVAVLLVSPYFLDSEFIASEELPKLLKAAKDEGVIILWVAISPSLVNQTLLADFQAVIDPAKPLSVLSRAERQTKLVEIAQRIQEALNR